MKVSRTHAISRTLVEQSSWPISALLGLVTARQRSLSFIAFATVLLIASSSYFKIAQMQNPRREVIAQIGDEEREQLRSIGVAGCGNRVLAGQDSRLAASDSRFGRAELAKHFDQVVQYCRCAFEAGSQLLTKDDVIKQWAAQGRAYEGALTAEERTLLDQSVRICAEEAGLRVDVDAGLH